MTFTNFSTNTIMTTASSLLSGIEFDSNDPAFENLDAKMEDLKDNRINLNPDSSLMEKLMNCSTTQPTKQHYNKIELPLINVEELIIYFFLAFLLIFLFIYLVRCVRTTLDPYNTVARVAWLETLDKRETKMFSSNGWRGAALG